MTARANHSAVSAVAIQSPPHPAGPEAARTHQRPAIGIAPHDALEREAEAVADRALGERPVALRGPLPSLRTVPGPPIVRTTATPHAPLIQRQPAALGDIPEPERTQLEVKRTSFVIDPKVVADRFTAGPNGQPNLSQSFAGDAAFGSGIDATLRQGLESIGVWLVNDRKVLPLGATIEVGLDLAPYGGDRAAYRFTRYQQQPGTGQASGAGEALLIERVGPLRKPATPADVPDRFFEAEGMTFSIEGTWSPEDHAIIRQAVSMLPPDARNAVPYLTFRRQTGTAPRGEAAHYVRQTHTINFYTIGTASVTSGGYSLALRSVLHEIGHAVDLYRLQEAYQAYAGSARTLEDRKELLKQRSLSGSRFAELPSGGFEEVEAIAERDSAFRRAVAKDSVVLSTAGLVNSIGYTIELEGGPTGYSNTDYLELFAESFAIYVTAPDVLKALRPNTAVYFERAFPAASPARTRKPSGGNTP